MYSKHYLYPALTVYPVCLYDCGLFCTLFYYSQGSTTNHCAITACCSASLLFANTASPDSLGVLDLVSQRLKRGLFFSFLPTLSPNVVAISSTDRFCANTYLLVNCLTNCPLLFSSCSLDPTTAPSSPRPGLLVGLTSTGALDLHLFSAQLPSPYQRKKKLTSPIQV